MAKSPYSPFPFYGYIRLLSIELPGAASDEIRCSLHPARLDHPPQYDALSYVWGDKDSSKTILCNGLPMEVGRNLHEALAKIRERMVQHADKARRNRFSHAIEKLSHLTSTANPSPYLIWIDALCIDQSNDRERSDQVKFMRQIYASARKVLIWLGPADEKTDLGMRLVRMAAEYWKRSQFEDQSPRLANMSDLAPRGIKKSLRLPGLNSPDWAALESIFVRPWFTRIWVVQEASVASSAALMIGNIEIPWETVVEAGRFVDHIQPLFKGPPREFRGLRTCVLIHLYEYEIQNKRLSLVDLLCDTRHFRATDPRDKIYALLGLSHEGADPKAYQLRPNYASSLLDVYRNATKYIIQKTESLAILSHAIYTETDKNTRNGSADHFPSWVPRWHDTKLAKSFSSHAGHRNNASAGITASYHPTPDPNVLTVSGLPFDTIKQVSSPLWAPGYDISPAVARKLDNPIWAIWATMARPLKPYPTGDSVMEAFLNVFRSGLEGRGTKESGGSTYSVADVKYWMRLIRQEDSLQGMLSILGSEINVSASDMMLIERRNDLEPDAMWLSGEILPIDAMLHNQETRFFTTEKGYMGVGAREIAVGDRVCVLFGSSLPFVLRPLERGYKLVGTCVAHGIMDGELIRKWRVGNNAKIAHRGDVPGENATPFEYGRRRRVVVQNKLNTIIGMGGVGCDLVQFKLEWHPNPIQTMEKVKNHEAEVWGQEENPRLARTIDEAPTILPSQRVTRVHTPGDRSLKMRYVPIGDPLGSGQFGVVHKAINIDSGKFMAVKIIERPASASKQEYEEWRKSVHYALKREVETLSRISHPHIVEYIASQG